LTAGLTISSGRTCGYRAAGVFALSTNDTADVAVVGHTGFQARIDEMMSVASGEPVLWVNTRTPRSSGPWSEANERAWGHALTGA
jgi:hypothetical protein